MNLRVLAVARKASVKGVPTNDIIAFLEGSIGAFRKRLATEDCAWPRGQLSAALDDLA